MNDKNRMKKRRKGSGMAWARFFCMRLSSAAGGGRNANSAEGGEQCQRRPFATVAGRFSSLASANHKHADDEVVRGESRRRLSSDESEELTAYLGQKLDREASGTSILVQAAHAAALERALKGLDEDCTSSTAAVPVASSRCSSPRPETPISEQCDDPRADVEKWELSEAFVHARHPRWVSPQSATGNGTDPALAEFKEYATQDAKDDGILASATLARRSGQSQQKLVIERSVAAPVAASPPPAAVIPEDPQDWQVGLSTPGNEDRALVAPQTSNESGASASRHAFTNSFSLTSSPETCGFLQTASLPQNAALQASTSTGRPPLPPRGCVSVVVEGKPTRLGIRPETDKQLVSTTTSKAAPCPRRTGLTMPPREPQHPSGQEGGQSTRATTKQPRSFRTASTKYEEVDVIDPYEALAASSTKQSSRCRDGDGRPRRTASLSTLSGHRHRVIIRRHTAVVVLPSDSEDDEREGEKEEGRPEQEGRRRQSISGSSSVAEAGSPGKARGRTSGGFESMHQFSASKRGRGGAGGGSKMATGTAGRVCFSDQSSSSGASEASTPVLRNRSSTKLTRRLSGVYEGHHVRLEKLRQQMGNAEEPPNDLLALMARRVFSSQGALMARVNSDGIISALDVRSSMQTLTPEQGASGDSGPASGSGSGTPSCALEVPGGPTLPPIRTRMRPHSMV